MAHDDFSRYGGMATQLPNFQAPDLHAQAPPNPDYPFGPNAKEGPAATAKAADGGSGGAAGTPWYNPCGWSLRTKLIVAAVTAAVIIAVVVGAVEGTKKNRYPDYTKLDYRLVEDYSGTGFFDKFEYFSGQDPTNGFVQYVTLYGIRGLVFVFWSVCLLAYRC